MQSNKVAQDAPCLCGSVDTRPFFRVGDLNRGLSDEEFLYRRCQSCQLVYLRPVPANLADYYPPDYYSAQSWTKELLDAVCGSEQFKLDLMQPYATGGRLLEIGPAWGQFAYQAKLQGFDVDTIEMDDNCCRFMRDVAGINAVNSLAPEDVLPQMGHYDVIALWHVIEHVPEPWKLLEAAARQLNPRGILAIAAPNPDSLQFRWFRRHWAHVDAPRHLQLIPPQLLSDRAVGCGLETVLATTTDPGGLHWNGFGWERSLKHRFPLLSERVIRVAARSLNRGLQRWETRPLSGTAYTFLFRRPS